MQPSVMVSWKTNSETRRSAARFVRRVNGVERESLPAGRQGRTPGGVRATYRFKTAWKI